MTKSTSFLTSLQKTIVKHSPTILMAVGGVGVIASVILASKASIKADEEIKAAREKRREESVDEDVDISFGDKAVIYAKCYAPTALMVVATEACIFGSNKINQKRIAAISAAYILKEADFKEYKQQVEEMVGPKKAQEIKDSLIGKHINDTPITPDNTIQSVYPNIPQGLKLDLWYDEVSKRYFYSNADYVRRAEIEANARLQKDQFVSVNDIYELLGLETIPQWDTFGWEAGSNKEVILKIGSDIKGPDMIVWTLFMDVEPSSDWYIG